MTDILLSIEPTYPKKSFNNVTLLPSPTNLHKQFYLQRHAQGWAGASRDLNFPSREKRKICEENQMSAPFEINYVTATVYLNICFNCFKFTCLIKCYDMVHYKNSSTLYKTLKKNNIKIIIKSFCQRDL